MSTAPEVAIVGAGPAGLMAAEVAAREGARVTVYERMASPARKLLLAGRGGLNLTHSEPAAAFLARYGTAAPQLAEALAGFDAPALRAWCADLGIATFVGTSGRVFPESFKTSPLLRAWLRRLDAQGVTLATRHIWRGFDGENLVFGTPDGPKVVTADAVVLALGGASWPQLGSDGTWAGLLATEGIDVAPLQPANCGFAVDWSDVFRERFEGSPLKAVGLAIADRQARGDLVVTRQGLEGGAIYALAPNLRDAITSEGAATIHVALRPDISQAALLARWAKRGRKESLSNALRKTLGLPPAAIGLLREAALPDGTTFVDLDDAALARLVNAIPLRLTAPMPLARAISTAGGVRFSDLDGSLRLKTKPSVFVAGEMLDWEAPTGGYLLQACFATGVAAGHAATTLAQKNFAAHPNQTTEAAL